MLLLFNDTFINKFTKILIYMLFYCINEEIMDNLLFLTTLPD